MTGMKKSISMYMMSFRNDIPDSAHVQMMALPVRHKGGYVDVDGRGAINVAGPYLFIRAVAASHMVAVSTGKFHNSSLIDSSLNHGVSTLRVSDDCRVALLMACTKARDLDRSVLLVHCGLPTTQCVVQPMDELIAFQEYYDFTMDNPHLCTHDGPLAVEANMPKSCPYKWMRLICQAFDPRYARLFMAYVHFILHEWLSFESNEPLLILDTDWQGGGLLLAKIVCYLSPNDIKLVYTSAVLPPDPVPGRHLIIVTDCLMDVSTRFRVNMSGICTVTVEDFFCVYSEVSGWHMTQSDTDSINSAIACAPVCTLNMYNMLFGCCAEETEKPCDIHDAESSHFHAAIKFPPAPTPMRPCVHIPSIPVRPRSPPIYIDYSHMMSPVYQPVAGSPPPVSHTPLPYVASPTRADRMACTPSTRVCKMGDAFCVYCGNDLFAGAQCQWDCPSVLTDDDERLYTPYCPKCGMMHAEETGCAVHNGSTSLPVDNTHELEQVDAMYESGSDSDVGLEEGEWSDDHTTTIDAASVAVAFDADAEDNNMSR